MPITNAFRVLGEVPQRGIYDTMKTAVDRIYERTSLIVTAK
jgi:transposase